MSDTLPTEDSRAFAGVPDGFDRLWTPYRMAYINGDHKPAGSSSEECPFCVAPSRTDEEGLIVHRGVDRKSTRLNSSHIQKSRMPSSA